MRRRNGERECECGVREMQSVRNGSIEGCKCDV